MLTSQELSQLLREQGYKVTPQRLAVYTALADETWHPSAETLFAKLQPLYPNMSFATVYKTMEILRRIRAVRVLSTGEDSFRFDANMSEHQHLQCTACGEVEDVMVPEVEAITAGIECRSGYSIQRRELYFYGLCPKCRKN